MTLAGKNENEQYSQFSFKGAWLPDIDPSRIGPENFQTLTNCRYIDNGIEGVNGYTVRTTSPLVAHPNIQQLVHVRSGRTQDSILFAYARSAAGLGRVYPNYVEIGQDGIFSPEIHTDSENNLPGRFSYAPQNHIIYTNTKASMIYAGAEIDCGAFITVDNAGFDNPKDYTEQANNTLDDAANLIPIGTQRQWLVFSTRPLQSVYFDVKTANATTSNLTVKTFDGTLFITPNNQVDNTASGGRSLVNSGTFTFDPISNPARYHYRGLYLFAYHFILSAGTAEIGHISCDAYWQDMLDIWDGVYRPAIQAQINRGGKDEDYTLQVNESSFIGSEFGMEINALANATDEIIIMAEDRLSAIKWVMFGGKVNTVVATLQIEYWNGSAYTPVPTLTDGTQAFSKSGEMTWTPPAVGTEQPHYLYGTPGYAYRITVDTGGPLSADVLADLVQCIPAPLTVRPFAWAATYKNRVMLGNYEAGNQRNRIDYSATDAPDVWNGAESSMDGIQSLYVGSGGRTTIGGELFNRYGSNVFTVFLILKNTETHILLGSGPEDFQLFPVSKNVGCPAPDTLAAAELGLEMSNEVVRNVRMWISYSGPVMFDGAILKPIDGIESFFKQENPESVNFEYIHTAHSEYDPLRKEWNLFLPTGSEQTPNTWLVYDMMRRKWYDRDTATKPSPKCAKQVQDPNGVIYLYGGSNDGNLYQLDHGTTYDGTEITQRIKTGDMWLTENIWDMIELRRMKLVAQRINEVTPVEIFAYVDTEGDPGMNVIYKNVIPSITASGMPGFEFADVTADITASGQPGVEWAVPLSSVIDLDITKGTSRLVRDTGPINQEVWCVSFEFRVATSNTPRGFRPIFWGLQWRFVRTDEYRQIDLG